MGGKDKDRVNGHALLSVVVTAEPGSQTLLLSGLAGIEMILYRHKALQKNAI